MREARAEKPLSARCSRKLSYVRAAAKHDTDPAHLVGRHVAVGSGRRDPAAPLAGVLLARCPRPHFQPREAVRLRAYADSAVASLRERIASCRDCMY